MVALPKNFNDLEVGPKSKRYMDAAEAGKLKWKPPAADLPDRLPLPPFKTKAQALQKVKAAEDAWNTRDPERVAAAYSADTVWRNRDEFLHGRDAVRAFLERKWARESRYRLRKHLWAHSGRRIAVRFEYEYYCEEGEGQGEGEGGGGGQWRRAHGIELWEFDDKGYMRWRDMSANDVPIAESERRLVD
ncbi:hypothetical protein JKP88DRAFT_270631 [Tribonema minus]|uniref:Uncharacterized protein n=1 Tax=Tribonema minus TaxID=303371 RepID=A0A835YWJ5_9STRA|nr:hypothetical protein JKP88DRAFT_270631 [Tribonema minus]